MKNLLLFLSLILLCSCDSDDDNETFTLANKVYKVVSFETESNMDLNGDGIFSTDLIAELASQSSLPISEMTMQFRLDGTVKYPWDTFPKFGIVDGEQVSSVGFLSSEPLEYTFITPDFRFDFGHMFTNGELINDGNTIVTLYNPSEVLSGFYEGAFMTEMGEIESYTGNYIITLELQD